MTTTFGRIRAILGEMQGNSDWAPAELAGALIRRDQSRSESNFHVMRGQLASKTPLSKPAFDALFRLMIKLGLIRETQSQKLMIQPRTTEVLEDEVKFGELITRRIMSILEDAGVPYGDIRTAANEIQLPEVRDPATILRKLQTNGNASEITDREFSRLLFLLACAGQRAERHIRTFYEFR